MTEKELIDQLNKFQAIKPNSDWADWLLNNILSQKKEQVVIRPKVKLVSFSIRLRSGQAYITKYRKALVPAFLVLIFVSTVALAQTTLPGNVLYPAKILTQNIKLALASSDYKPVVRMQITKERLQDIARVSDQEQVVASLTQNIKQDLNAIPKELKNIPKKEIALKASQQVKEKGENLSNIVNQINLETQDKEELAKTVSDTQNQVLALILETTEKINQCPSYLQVNINNLQNYFNSNIDLVAQWPISDITKVKMYLVEIGDDMKAGNCLEAMDKIESINQLLQIHSLDSSTQNSLENFEQIKVETSTSGSSD